MILSHGKNSIEPRFLTNKEILDNNWLKKLLISQRLIYHHFTSENIVIHEYIVPPGLKDSCKLANGRYKLVLEGSNKETVDLEKCRYWKLRLEEITNVKKQKTSSSKNNIFLE